MAKKKVSRIEPRAIELRSGAASRQHRQEDKKKDDGKEARKRGYFKALRTPCNSKNHFHKGPQEESRVEESSGQ